MKTTAIIPSVYSDSAYNKLKSPETIEAVNSAVRLGTQNAVNIKKIAYIMSHISKQSLELDGYTKGADLFIDVLGLKKSQAYNMQKVGALLLKRDGSSVLATENGEDYSLTQLVHLLPTGKTVEQIQTVVKEKEINPYMTVAAIDAKLKALPEKTSNSNQAGNSESTEPAAETAPETAPQYAFILTYDARPDMDGYKWTGDYRTISKVCKDHAPHDGTPFTIHAAPIA